MNFKSDNITAIHPQIMEAIIESNQGYESSYGSDNYSIKLKKVFSEIFEKEVEIYLTSTGTAANSLALASLVKPHEVIYCQREAHLITDECSAPEFYTGGCRLEGISGSNGKIDILLLEEAITKSESLRPHGAKPGCISITQATECGTVYTTKDIENIKIIAQKHHLPIHMDGARFANSLVSIGCSPAELTWKQGIDIMSFGATKNGAMAAEAIVFFNGKYSHNFDYLHKRAGQLISKTRFFAAQFLGYFENNLWLKNAKHSNDMAQELLKIFQEFHIKNEYPVESNEIFVTLDPQTASLLQKAGCGFYEWGQPGSHLYRFVTSCFTNQKDLKDIYFLLSRTKKS